MTCETLPFHVHDRDEAETSKETYRDRLVNSDNCKNIMRLVFLDFKKAFELIDHNIVAKKLDLYEFPPHIALWTLSFLQHRKQFVKLGTKISSVLDIDAGAPQGTRAGPNVFKLLINDLRFSLPYIKYVDDVSVVASSVDPLDTSLHRAVNEVAAWCEANGMFLNVTKTKEMVIYFGKATQKSRFHQFNCRPLPLRKSRFLNFSV